MVAGVVFIQVLILFVIVGMGFAVGRLKILSENAKTDISRLITTVTLPATIIQSLLREYDERLVKDGLYCLLIGLAMLLLFLAITALLRKPLGVKEGRRGIWSFASSICNAGFMGIPVSQAVFGPDGAFFAAMFVVAMNIISYSLGVAILMKDGKGERDNFLKKVLLNSANLATAAGLIIFICQIRIPEAAVTIINYLAGITTPLAMFLIGLYVSENKLKEIFNDKDVLTSSALKLLVFPMIAFAVVKLFPFGAGLTARNSTLLEMAMPAPAITMILASRYECDTGFAGKVVCLSTLFSLVTIPLIMLLAA